MRRPTALACVLALALAGPALAQTGDEQYQDPFAEDAQAQTQQAPPLTDSPPVTTTPSGGGQAPAATPQPGAGTAPAQAGALPDTGAEAWATGLAGAALLLLGVGLRLRTTDERF
jgi:LPXTG-motif cell wall-anchored protein